jgi:hypothetical protein
MAELEKINSEQDEKADNKKATCKQVALLSIVC